MNISSYINLNWMVKYTQLTHLSNTFIKHCHYINLASCVLFKEEIKHILNLGKYEYRYYKQIIKQIPYINFPSN